MTCLGLFWDNWKNALCIPSWGNNVWWLGQHEHAALNLVVTITDVNPCVTCKTVIWSTDECTWTSAGCNQSTRCVRYKPDTPKSGISRDCWWWQIAFKVHHEWVFFVGKVDFWCRLFERDISETIRSPKVKFQHTVHIEMVYNCAKFHLPEICVYVVIVLKYFIKV